MTGSVRRPALWLIPLALAGVVQAQTAAVPSPPASAPLIAWSADQARNAGVATQVVQPVAASPGAGLTLQGTVTLPPQAQTVVSTPLAAVVQQLLVGPGEPVAAGAALAQLQSPQLMEWQRELLTAQSQADLAAAKLRRDEKLLAEGIIPEARVQESRSAQRVAQLALAERRQALQLAGAGGTRGFNPQLTLKAPSAGTVMEVLGQPGARLEAGAPVVKLVRAGQLAIELQATAEQAARLRVGDALKVDGCQAPARLAAVAPQVNAGNQSVLLRADFKSAEPCLRVNQFVQVQVQGSAADAQAELRVSPTAVVQQAGQSYVFVKRPNGFAPVAVQVGAGGAGGVPVLRGLAAGDEVAVRGTAALKGAWQGLGAPEAGK